MSLFLFDLNTPKAIEKTSFVKLPSYSFTLNNWFERRELILFKNYHVFHVFRCDEMIDEIINSNLVANECNSLYIAYVPVVTA